MPPLRAPAGAKSSADDWDIELPDIKELDSFRTVVRKLSKYFEEVIELPSTFEQLRTTSSGNCLRVLVDHLAKNCENQAIVNALLALKWHYAVDDENEQGLGPTRSSACEIVAWRFLTRFPERVALDYCLYEIPEAQLPSQMGPLAAQTSQDPEDNAELAPLLSRFSARTDRSNSISAPTGSKTKRSELLFSLSRLTEGSHDSASAGPDDEDPSAAFEGLNALEIAAVADAKRFLSQHVVQKILTGIWNGQIVYWDALSLHARKQPRFYHPDRADPYSRLRVPKYMKCWEVVFFGIFLCLFYAVLIVPPKDRLTGVEFALWFWFAAFLFDELSEWGDAGSVIYTADIWNFFDMIVILIGIVFIILRIIGLIQNNHELSGWAFDILALEALFLIPRICSILSLSPYWGTLIPCLKEMGKDFCKFMVLLAIFFLGFLTTFSLLGRGNFRLGSMSIILTRIFFGSSYVGFDIMDQIDPIFGPPLMIILVIFSNILLLSSLTGILSNSFSRVINHAREEYLYVYAVYVLEASTSNRLIHFYPPFNFIAWIMFGPLSLAFPNSPAILKARIAALKISHLPIIAVIKAYECLQHRESQVFLAGFESPAEQPRESHRRPTMPQIRPSSAYNRPTMPLLSASAFGKMGKQKSEDVDEDVNADTSLAAQIAELNSKIDNITTALLAMQQNQSIRTEAAAAEGGTTES
ncbi:uncharacterized protein F5Z01DRAFT_26514 [Emericellopsis atlantica]|uniref:Calcium channel YVC1-like C-terminal transmembrane domain-containing protein n=1 Tax=Emericellopsis atlantica TaxID=2614577 RepID=A0A9P7ZWY1_9HYPO|nr:uncharacterized protein F5Z01DRAFT_26514 [Emericellopsis atlantica]KAG9259132.1 hypothetical protein F5Z01DRAFT_26514 [Emericellopsis atlantica]